LVCLEHAPSRPRTSADLFDKYSLSALAAEVAREKPNGEKNALRKTYKGHIKRLGITGHFDAHKFDPDKDPMRENFFHMLAFPELEWSVHEVKGSEITNGLSDQVMASLGRAMTMAKGKVISKAWDASVLGELAPVEMSKQVSSAKPTAPSTPAATTPAGATAGAARPKQPLMAAQGQGQDPARPKRSVKKRSYGDSSFEGYGEGYPDDDIGMETGYSSGGGDDRGGQKRRKVGDDSPHRADISNRLQGPGSSQQPQFSSAVRQQSYGPGMVGA
jgi:hypothetical protein